MSNSKSISILRAVKRNLANYKTQRGSTKRRLRPFEVHSIFALARLWRNHRALPPATQRAIARELQQRNAHADPHTGKVHCREQHRDGIGGMQNGEVPA